MSSTNKNRNQRPQSFELSATENLGTSPNGQQVEPSTFNNFAIPPNKRSKNYSMEEVFQVWYDNKDTILNTPVELPNKRNENYRLATPGQIYHLDLQPSSSNTTVNNVQELSNSVGSLSLREMDPELNPERANSQPPPGMMAVQSDNVQGNNLSLISSEQIEWFYLDPSGNEQGPFNGEMMQKWLTDGYLNLDLKIRRKEESNYLTLKEFCEKVQNYIQPFKIPLPDLTVVNGMLDHSVSSVQFPNQNQSQFHQFLSNGQGGLGAGNMRLNTTINPRSNIFGNEFMTDRISSPFTPLATTSFSNTGNNQFAIDPINTTMGFGSLSHINTMPSLLQSQLHQQQQPVLQRTHTGWGIDATNGAISSPGTPVAVAPTLPSQMNQAAPVSPWIADVQSLSRVSSPFVPVTPLSNNTQEGLAENMNLTNNGSDRVLDQIHTSVVTGILGDGEGAQEKQFTQTVKQDVSTKMEPTLEKEIVNEVPKPTLQKPEVVEAPEPKVSKKQKNKPDVASPISEKVSVATPEPLKPSVPPQQKLAPWASLSSDNLAGGSKPALTLKEIQRIEAEKQKQLEAELKSEQTALNLSMNEVEQTEKAPFFPTTSSWAVTSQEKAAVTKKTLADIQREEAEAKAKIANKNKPTFASALSNSVPKDDGTWSTVTSKKSTTTTKKPIQIVNTSSSSAITNPLLLRSVSATAPANTSNNSTAMKEDFLVWARSAMSNLYPTVAKDELLDIFITLPLNSSESSQLISETIYSSSATMDGRRYAEEFLKRRQKLEQQIGPQDPTSWSAAIISSADKVGTVDEDGWSTSVKPKKKGKKY